MPARTFRSLAASRALLTQVAAGNPWLEAPLPGRPWRRGRDLVDVDRVGEARRNNHSPGRRRSGTSCRGRKARSLCAGIPAAALQIYLQALGRARSADERAELLSRAGRCRFKTQTTGGGSRITGSCSTSPKRHRQSGRSPPSSSRAIKHSQCGQGGGLEDSIRFSHGPVRGGYRPPLICPRHTTLPAAADGLAA